MYQIVHNYFWISLLLQETAVELECFAKMLTLDFECGHINYACWGSVNIAEAQRLAQETTEVYHGLKNSPNAVYKSGRYFSGVWHDKAIEQTLIV